jgi:hypothetical protein
MYPATIAPAVNETVARRAAAYVEMIRELVRASADGDGSTAERAAVIMASAGGHVGVVGRSFEAIAAQSPQPEPVGPPTHEPARIVVEVASPCLAPQGCQPLLRLLV